MAEGAGELLSRLGEVVSRLEQLETRVASLEARGTAPARARGGRGGRRAGGGRGARGAPTLPSGTLALVGRTLLVLAGAYVVRALTEGQALPAAVGVAIGIAYAAALQLLADREAALGRVQSAAFHDVASSLIAFPLLWEAVTRFRLLPAAAAAAALVAFFALGLAVAWHRRLVANAVVTTALALGTALALLVSTHDLLAGVVSLLAIAAGLEWLACHGAWLGLRWPAAAVLDGVALLLVAVTTRPELPEGYAPVPAAAAVLLLVAIPALYIASVAARTLRLGQPVTAFEVVQGAVAVAARVRRRGARARRARPRHHGPRGARAPARAPVLRRRVRLRRAPARAGPQLLLLLDGRRAAHARRNRARGPRPGASARLGRRGPRGGAARAALRPHDAAGSRRAAPRGRRAAGRAVLGVRAVARRRPGRGRTPPAAWACAAAAAAAWLVLAGDPAASGSGASRLPQLLLALVVVAAAAPAGARRRLGLCRLLAGGGRRRRGGRAHGGAGRPRAGPGLRGPPPGAPRAGLARLPADRRSAG